MFSPMTGVSRDEDVVPMMSGSGFPNQRVRRSQLTASAVRFPVGQSSSAQQRKMEGGRSKVGGDRSKKTLLSLLLQRLSQGATRFLESTLGIYFVSSTTESDYLVFAYSANRRSAIGFCVSVTVMGLIGVPLWISSLPWLFIFWDYLAMLWWTLCAVALWVLRMRFEEAASIPNDAEEGECQEGVSQGSVISGLQQRLRQNAWQHELCLVGVTFACVWFCVGLNGAQQSCEYIPLERRLVDCREAINTEGLIILLVLSMVYLIPARLILHVPLFVLWGVSFLGVVYVTVPEVIPAYFQSEVSLIVCEMVVAIGTLFVRERSRRRVFRLHQVREARSVELVKVREDMKRLLAVQLPVEVAAAAASSTTSDVLMTEQGISQSDTAEGDGRGTRRRASISHPTATATLHGHVQPWKMYKNAVVVTFRIDGLSKWCCRRGPCDVVELLKIVFDTLDAVWGEDDSQTPVRPIVETRLLSVTSKTKTKRGGPIRSRTKVHTVGDMYTVVIEEDEEDKQDDDATNGQQAEEQERRGGGGGDSATKISMRASGSNTTTTTTFRWMTESSHPEAVRGGSQRDEVRRDSSTMQQERSNPTSSLIRLQLAPIDWSCGPTSNRRSQRRPPLLLRVMECAVRCNAQLRKAQIHTRKLFAGTNNMGNRILSPQLRTMLTPCDVVETRNSRGNDDVGTTSQAIRDSIGLCVGIGYGNVRGLFFSSSRTVGLDGEGMDQAHRCAARQNVRGQKLARWLDEDVGSSQEMQHVPLLVPSVVMSPQWMVFTTSRLRATNNKNTNSNNNSIVVEQVHQHGASASSLGACSVVGQPTDKREDVLQCIVSALQSADDVFIEEQNGENGGESLSSHSLEDDNDEEDADSRSVIVSLMLSVASPPHLNQRHDACEEGPDASVDATPLPNNNTNNNGNNASSSLMSGTAFAAGEGGAGRGSDQPVTSPSPRVGLMSRQPVVVVPNISFPSSGTARSDGLNSSPLTRVAGPFMMEHEGFQLTPADHQLPLVSVSIVRMDRSTAAAAPPPSDNSRTSQQTEMKNPLSAPLTKSQGMSLASTSETTITLATTTRHEQAKKKEEEEELQSSSKFSMSVQWLLFAHFVDESIENRYLLSLEVLQLDEAIWSACAPLFSFTGIIGILAVYSIWNLESARDPLLWVLVGTGASLLLLIMALASQRLPQWFDRRLLLFNVRLGDLVNMILCHCCTISYCAAVFVTPSGNVLGDSQFIFLFIVLNWSMMRPAFGTRATTLWVTDFFLCIAFLLRTLSRPGSSWSRISLLYGEGIMVPYTLLLRMLIDQSRRKAFAVEIESESLKAEIEQDNKKLSELTRLVAPRGVSGRLLQNIVEQTKRQMQQRNKDGVYPGGGGASFSTSRRINDSVSIFAAGSFSRRTDHHTAAGPHTTQNRHRGAHPLISTDWSSSVWEVPFLIIRLNKSALEQRVAVETGNQQRNVVSVAAAAAAAAGSSTSAAGLYNGMSTMRMRSSSATSIVVTTTTPPLAVDHNAGGGGGGGGARSRSAQSTVSSSAQALDMLLERAHAAVYALIQQWAQPVYGCLEMIKSSPYEMRICVANMADERRKRQDGDELRCDQLLQFAALASRALDSWWLSVTPQLVAPIPSPSQTLRVNGYLMALTCGPMIGGVLGQHCVSFDMYGAPVYEALAMLDRNRFDMECAVGPHNETTKPTSSSDVDERRGMIFASYRFIRRCAFFRNWQRPILAAVVPPNPCATTTSEEMEVREEEERLFLVDAMISNSAVNGGEEEGSRMSMALKQRLTAAAPDATCLSVSVSSRSTLKCSDVGGSTLSFYVLHCSLE